MNDPAALSDLAQIGLPANAGERIDVPAGQRLFGRGSPCNQFVLVLSGVVRVQTVSPSGREITLYRVGPGEACVMTTACLLAGVAYAAQGVAETPCALLILSRPAFELQLAGSETFRRFVFGAFGTRLVDLMTLFEEVTFERMDVRLADYLLQSGADELDITHQAIATELGSAREVISRHLKEFERRGWVSLLRGRVRVRNQQAMRALAGH